MVFSKLNHIHKQHRAGMLDDRESALAPLILRFAPWLKRCMLLRAIDPAGHAKFPNVISETQKQVPPARAASPGRVHVALTTNCRYRTTYHSAAARRHAGHPPNRTPSVTIHYYLFPPRTTRVRGDPCIIASIAFHGPVVHLPIRQDRPPRARSNLAPRVDRRSVRRANYFRCLALTGLATTTPEVR